MKPTHQQKALIQAIGKPTKEGRLLIGSARAGTGKTSTLLEAAIGASDSGREVFVGVFNKAIQMEWQRKLDSRGVEDGVDARTFHSLGLQTIGKAFSGNGKRVTPADSVLKEVLKPFGLQGRVWAGTMKLTDFGKQTLLSGASSAGEWEACASHFGLDEDYRPNELTEILRFAPKVLEAGIARFKETLEVDFADMLYLPWRFELQTPNRYAVVMVDEAQDSNEARRDLAWKLLAPRGILVPVGDDRQAIFGFTGASAQALNEFQDTAKEKGLATREFPLTVCFRCPRKVIEFAREIVPDIEAREGAPKGRVEEMSEEKAFTALAAGDAVLCRFNAPLAKLSLRLLRAKRPVRIEGRDLAKSILSLAAKFGQTSSLRELQRKAQDSWEADRRALMLKGSPQSKLDSLDDRYETLLYFVGDLLSQGKTAVTELSSLLYSLFEDTSPGHPGWILLSSIHKAKGREWKRVWLWGFDTLRMQKGLPWEQTQEENLRYVAITRSQEELFIVEMER